MHAYQKTIILFALVGYEMITLITQVIIEILTLSFPFGEYIVNYSQLVVG